MIRVKCFEDQDRDRLTVNRVCAAQVADLLLQIDLVTSGGGGYGVLEQADGVDAEEYRAFRRWLGGELQTALQALVGNVLSGALVAADGRVRLDLEWRAPEADPLATLGARIDWLVGEIHLLQDAYGQLYAAEWRRLRPLLDEADELDLAIPAQLDRAKELWNLFEAAYRHAQPGARIYRSDEEAIATRREQLDAMAAQLDAAEADRRRVLALADGEAAPLTAEDYTQAFAELKAQRRAAEQRIERLKEGEQAARAELQAVAERVTALVMALPDDVDADDLGA